MNTYNKLQTHIQNWLITHPLSPQHIDCTTTVMLKILDGKCKMDTLGKQVMEILYDYTKHQKGILLTQNIHDLIQKARTNPDSPQLKEAIHQQRILAEEKIEKVIMKAFKTMLNETKIFN